MLSRSLLLFALVFSTGIAGGTAAAANPKIADSAGLFHQADLSEAKAQVQEIRLHYRQNLVIETFKDIPFFRDPLGQVKRSKDPESRKNLFRDWARRRAPRSDGIYVFIFKDATELDVRVEVGSATRKDGLFSSEEAEQLRQQLTAGLESGKPGPTLLKAISFVQDRLHLHVGGSLAPVAFAWSMVLSFLIGLGGLWVALEVCLPGRASVNQGMYGGACPLGFGFGRGIREAMRTVRNEAAAQATPLEHPPATPQGDHPVNATGSAVVSQADDQHLADLRGQAHGEL